MPEILPSSISGYRTEILRAATTTPVTLMMLGLAPRQGCCLWPIYRTRWDRNLATQNGRHSTAGRAYGKLFATAPRYRTGKRNDQWRRGNSGT